MCFEAMKAKVVMALPLDSLQQSWHPSPDSSEGSMDPVSILAAVFGIGTGLKDIIRILRAIPKLVNVDSQRNEALGKLELVRRIVDRLDRQTYIQYTELGGEGAQYTSELELYRETFEHTRNSANSIYFDRNISFDVIHLLRI